MGHTCASPAEEAFGISRLSAAALGFVDRPKSGLFVGAIAVLLALVAAGGSARPAATAAAPLLQVTPTELRLSQPLVALAAEQGRAAFAFCNQLVGVWRPGASGVTRLGPLAQWACPPPRGPERVFSLALAGDRVAWAAGAGGNIVTNLLFLVVLGRPDVLTIAADYSYCCRGNPDPERMGDVYGDAGFIAFSSRVKCNDMGAPACPSGTQPTLLSQTVWRLRRPPYQAPCVGKPGPCVQLATLNDVLQPLSVDSGRVALRQSNGTLVLRNSSGGLVRQFAALAGLTRAAELMGGSLVVLVPGSVQQFSLTTGARLRARPVPNVPSAGVCGMPPCPPATLRLVDASRGLVAYILSGKLHLLRLRDGRDRMVATATDARFGDTGLFYAYVAPAPWPSRVRFVPWAALPVRP
jgi:hypothetical protein